MTVMVSSEIGNQVVTDEGLALKRRLFKSFYGGQFTLSTQLIKTNFQLSFTPPTYRRTTTVSLDILTPFSLESKKVWWIHTPGPWKLSVVTGFPYLARSHDVTYAFSTEDMWWISAVGI